MSRQLRITSLVAIYILHGQSLFADENDFVVQVRGRRSLTGFRVHGVPGIFTALHGVIGSDEITIRCTGDVIVTQPVTIQRVNVAYDLAIVGSEELDRLERVGFSRAPALIGERLTDRSVTVLGYPHDSRKQIISGLKTRQRPFRPLQDIVNPQTLALLRKRRSPAPHINVIHFQGDIVPGHSGAPILDEQERVIGVANGGLVGGTTGHVWAVPLVLDDFVPYDVSVLDTLRRHTADELFAVAPAQSTSSTADDYITAGKEELGKNNHSALLYGHMAIGRGAANAEAYFLVAVAQMQLAMRLPASSSPAWKEMVKEAIEYQRTAVMIDPQDEEYRAYLALMLCSAGTREDEPAMRTEGVRLARSLVSSHSRPVRELAEESLRVVSEFDDSR